MNVGSPGSGGGVSGYQYDMSNASEVQVTIAGGLGEVDRGGPAFNMIPKTGGNTFSGTYFASFAGKWAQASNIDDELRTLRIRRPAGADQELGHQLRVSGPILRDRIWFFANARPIGTYQDVPNQYGNLNAGNPNVWTYASDDSVNVRNANSKKLIATRLTWQATQQQQVRVLHRLHEELLRRRRTRKAAVSAARPATAGRRRVPASARACPPLAGVGNHLGRAREDHAGARTRRRSRTACSSKPASRRSGPSRATSGRRRAVGSFR